MFHTVKRIITGFSQEVCRANVENYLSNSKEICRIAQVNYQMTSTLFALFLEGLENHLTKFCLNHGVLAIG